MVVVFFFTCLIIVIKIAITVDTPEQQRGIDIDFIHSYFESISRAYFFNIKSATEIRRNETLADGRDDVTVSAIPRTLLNDEDRISHLFFPKLTSLKRKNFLHETLFERTLGQCVLSPYSFIMLFFNFLLPRSHS